MTVSFVYETGRPKGTAHSIRICKEKIRNDNFAVIFSDVIFQRPLEEYIKSFDPKKYQAKFLLAYSDQPQNHATVFFKKGKIDRIIEKCDDPDKKVIITTYDIFTSKVWRYFHLLRPSSRSELEITDLRNFMIKNERTEYEFVKGWWIDIGTHERLKKAAKLVKQ